MAVLVESTSVRVDGDELGALMMLCAQADHLAFASLYDSTAHRVYGLSLRVIRNHAHAEEVTHETFIDIWRYANRFDPSRGTAQSWILTIAHRRAVDRVRSATSASERETKYHRLHHAEDYDSTGEVALRNVEGEDVRAAMSRLKPLQRQAIELSYFGGLTHTEVADALQIPVGTAKARIRGGLIRLRADLSSAARLST